MTLTLTVVTFEVMVDVLAEDVTVSSLGVETTTEVVVVPELSAAADAADVLDAVEVSQAAVELLDDMNGFESLPPWAVESNLKVPYPSLSCCVMVADWLSESSSFPVLNP